MEQVEQSVVVAARAEAAEEDEEWVAMNVPKDPDAGFSQVPEMVEVEDGVEV